MPKVRKTTLDKVPIEERRRAALLYYCQLGAERTLKKTHEWVCVQFGKCSISTLMAWSNKFGWQDEVAKYDKEHKAAHVLVELDAIFKQFENSTLADLLEKVGRKAVIALLANPITARTPSEQRAVAQIAVDAIKMRELLLNPESADARGKIRGGVNVAGDLHVHAGERPVLKALTQIEQDLQDLASSRALPAPDAAPLQPPAVVDVVAEPVVVAPPPAEPKEFSEVRYVDAAKNVIPAAEAERTIEPAPAKEYRDVRDVAEEAARDRKSFAQVLGERAERARQQR